MTQGIRSNNVGLSSARDTGLNAFLRRGLLCAALMGIPTFSLAEQALARFLVLVNPASSIQQLNQDEVSRIFLRKLKVMPDGSQVFPVGQLSNPSADGPFYLAVTQRDSSQLAAYWARLLFTGRDRPPVDGKNDAGVLEILRANPRAIGYISATTSPAEMRIVYRVE